MDKQQQQELDKYYTKSEVSRFCYSALLNICELLNLKNNIIIEPSAGDGSFLLHIKEKFLAFDIAPQKNNKIKFQDYLSLDLNTYSEIISNSNIVFLGNPPFGKRGKLALSFLNKAINEGKIVGFIVPLQFRKWSIQSKVESNAFLVADYDLSEDSFLFMGKPYKLRCCFQIWTKEKTNLKNLRILRKPSISHPDFEMFQYNCTKQAEKYFDYDWDFAVPRQGYLDYSQKISSKELCNKRHQWMFLKAKNKTILQKLLSIDFEKLSKNNTGTPGFGKHDVVSAYINL